MRYRTMGRLGWEVGEVGYGMWRAGPEGVERAERLDGELRERLRAHSWDRVPTAWSM